MPDPMYSMEYRGLGGRFSPGANRYAAALIGKQNYNNGTHAGGIASMAQNILQAMLLKGEMDQEQKAAADMGAANSEMVRGMSAQPWKNPDMGGAQTNVQEGTGKIVPTGPAGGYEGGIAALSNLQGNPYAGRLSQQLVMADMGRKEKLADTASEREFTLGRDASGQNFQREMNAGNQQFQRETQTLGFQNQRQLQGDNQQFQRGQMETQQQFQERMARLQAELTAAQESFGTPMPMTQNGQPVMVQPGNRGTMRPTGFAPPPEKVTPKDARELADAAAKDVESLASTDKLLRSTDRLMTHPGREGATGKSSVLNFAQIGTDEASFLADLDTMKSRSFLPMVAQLKGMGALSDAEGKKLTDAIGALNPNMKEEDFLASLREIESDLMAARSRLPGGKGGQGYMPQRLEGQFNAPGRKPGESVVASAPDDPLGLRR